MAEFTGPRPEYEEHAAGTIGFEIDLELWSNSGRPKHVDLTEQGGFLADAIARAIEKFEVGDDSVVHRLRYLGEVEESTEGVVAQHEIRRH